MLQDALQQKRAIDDRIVYKLNTSVPTESFAGQVDAKEQCMSLYGEVRNCVRTLMLCKYHHTLHYLGALCQCWSFWLNDPLPFSSTCSLPLSLPILIS